MPAVRVVFAFGLALVATPVATAQSTGGDFALTRSVVAGGGRAAEAGPFRAASTLAQPALGTASGGDFVLSGGFHVPTGIAPGGPIFADGFEGVSP
jgi:hypothetical protein